MTALQSRVLLSLIIAWVAVISVLTLLPMPNTPPLTLEGFLCVGCGGTDTADIIMNWMVFLPGGALMALALGGTRAVFAAACLTVLVETLQIAIPGRDPSLQDLLSNTLGALSGVLIVRRGLGKHAQRGLAVLAVVAWLSPAVLLIPMTSRSVLFGQWTPAFTAVERYQGRILSASVGGLSVRTGIVPRRAPLDTAIVERYPIELLLEAGAAPRGFAPVFQVVDSLQASIVTLGAWGEDLILNGHNPSRLLRLGQPDVRWPNGMRDVTPGDTVRLLIERARESVCMSVNERTVCGLAPSLGDGWGHLAYLAGWPSWLRGLMSMAWCVGLGLLLGATSTSARASAIRGGALAGAGLAVCFASPDVRPDMLHAALLAAASPLGNLVRAPIAGVWPRVTGTALVESAARPDRL